MIQYFPQHYAKFPHLFVHTPGLFSCTYKGEHYRRKLDFCYEPDDEALDSTYHFLGLERLRAIDLLVLHGVVTMACASLACKEQTTALFLDGTARKPGLALTGDACAQIVIAVRFKLSKLAQTLACVPPSMTTLPRLRYAIDRLNAVTVQVERPGFQGSYRLTSGYWRDTETGDVVIALNPELTVAVLQKKDVLRLEVAHA